MRSFSVRMKRTCALALLFLLRILAAPARTDQLLPTSEISVNYFSLAARLVRLRTWVQRCCTRVCFSRVRACVRPGDTRYAIVLARLALVEVRPEEEALHDLLSPTFTAADAVQVRARLRSFALLYAALLCSVLLAAAWVTRFA